MSDTLNVRVPVQLYRHEAAPLTQTWTLRWHPLLSHIAVLEHERLRTIAPTHWRFPRRLLGDGQLGPARHAGFEAYPVDDDWMVVRIGEAAAVLPGPSVRRFMVDTDPAGKRLLADVDGSISAIYRHLASVRCPLCHYATVGQCRRPACLAESHRADADLDLRGEL